MGGSSVWDGTLSPDEFNASAKALVAKWAEIDDVDDSLPDWAWRPCCKMGVPSETEGFLALEGVYKIDESKGPDDEGIVEHDTWVQSSSDDNVHVYDFHIVYSFSYKVPMLYFQGHEAGGQLLTIDEIKKDLPAHSLQVLSESKWTFITREEHPHLSWPWFTLHPCGTSEWMKLLLDKLGDKDRSLQYLSAWLSVVGQAVGLKIPLKLYCSDRIDVIWPPRRVRDYCISVSTRDGLLILMDRESYSTVSVLNPFTGYLIRFIAPVPDQFVESATLLSGSSPTLVMLLCNKMYADYDPDGSVRDCTRTVYMGDPSSESFLVYEEKNACPLIRLAARGIYTDGVSGSASPFSLAGANGIFKLMRVFKADCEISDDEDSMMSKEEAVWNSLVGYDNRVFLLESAGELLIIIKLKGGMEIYKVDTDRCILKHVKDIGNRAIFLGGYCKCMSVNADMFPSVDANCIYYIKGAYLSDDFSMYGDTMYKDIHMYKVPCRREKRISEDKYFGSPPYTTIQLLSGSLTGV